ncbi:MAG: hypothetical protein GY773_15135 [Actinomycetia bacterium]|nr:hypothetical protein [Actinomycetes bacterium]
MSDLQTMWSSLVTHLDAHRPRVGTAPAPTETAIPVTLLTGFLGTGKSSLLVRLLSAPPENSVVKAVVNDIGSLPFDPTLVVGRGAESRDLEIELTNGCGCCERTADLAATLDRLAGEGPDLIVLEASGVADPMAVAQVIEASDVLRLDRIVTVIDATAFEGQLDQPKIGPTVGRQLDAAHSVIVSHADRLASTELERVVALVAEAAPGRVVTTSSLEAPASDVLTSAVARGARFISPGDPPVPPQAHGLVTMTIDEVRPLSRAELDQILAERPVGIVRAKGCLHLDEGPVSVQLTPTSTMVNPCEAGPCGFTIIATEAAAAETLAASFSRPGLGH